MRKSRFTEQQIAFALRRAETGTKVSEVCRKIGVAEATSYKVIVYICTSSVLLPFCQARFKLGL